MKKEEVYLDLEKLSREEIKDVYKVLKENNQDLLFAYIGCVLNGNYFKKEKYLVFCRPSANSWTCSKDFEDRYEINLQQFKELFKNSMKEPVMITLPIEDYNRLRKLEIKQEIKRLKRELKRL